MRKIWIYPFVQSLGILLVCLALGSGSALASHHKTGQGHMMKGHHGMGHAQHMRGGKGGAWGMDMFAYVPMAILYQKDLLGLSEQQVQKIRSIKKEMRKSSSNHETIEQIHEQMESAFKGGQFDLSAYESALKKAADYVVQARLQAARNAQDALKVLDKDQRTRFLYSMQVMHSWIESHGMKHKMRGMDKEDKDDKDEEAQQAN